MDTPEGRWAHLEEYGRNHEADIQSDADIDEKPGWLDEERFKQARKVTQKYAIGIEHSTIVGQLLILLFPEIIEPLLAAGNCRDIPHLYNRSLHTTIHINSWYEDDIFDPKTKGYRSIRHVRRMHKSVQNMMTNKLKVSGANGEPTKWFTQWDMAVSQFSFVGLAIIYPKRSGLIAATENELELVNYYWRVLGHLMGIRDEFNLCHFDEYHDIVSMYKLAWDLGFVKTFRESPCPQGIEMCKAICLSLEYFMPHISFNTMVHWWKDIWTPVLGEEFEPLTNHDRLLYAWTYLQFTYLLRWNPLIEVQNSIFSKIFKQKLRNKESEYEKLKAKYANDTTYTFYSDRIDYPVNAKRNIISATNPKKNQQADSSALFKVTIFLMFLIVSLSFAAL